MLTSTGTRMGDPRLEAASVDPQLPSVNVSGRAQNGEVGAMVWALVTFADTGSGLTIAQTCSVSFPASVCRADRQTHVIIPPWVRKLISEHGLSATYAHKLQKRIDSSMVFPSVFGQRLRETRTLRHWTQEQLAARSGVTAAVHQPLRDQHTPAGIGGQPGEAREGLVGFGRLPARPHLR